MTNKAREAARAFAIKANVCTYADVLNLAEPVFDQIQQLTAQLRELELRAADTNYLGIANELAMPYGSDIASRILPTIKHLKAENESMTAQLAAAREALAKIRDTGDSSIAKRSWDLCLDIAEQALATPSPAADALLEDAQAWRSRLKMMDTYFDSVDEFLAARAALKASTKEEA